MSKFCLSLTCFQSNIYFLKENEENVSGIQTFKPNFQLQLRYHITANNYHFQFYFYYEVH